MTATGGHGQPQNRDSPGEEGGLSEKVLSYYSYSESHFLVCPVLSRAVSLAQTITQPRQDRRMARIQRRRRRAQRDAPSTWLRAAAVGGTR